MSMNKYKTWWYSVVSWGSKILAGIHWNGLRALFNGGVYYDLKEADHDQIKQLLATEHYIVLNWRKSHLTTWLIGLISLVKEKKWPRYTHALMNVDREGDSSKWSQFLLMEATGTGVHPSTFMQVFDCDHVCLLRPKNLSSEKWDAVIQGLLEQDGYSYDNLFDLSDQTRVSCVELVLNALKKSPSYAQDFPHLEEMIQKVGNLTPQMYRECEDFEVVFEKIY